MTQGTEALNSGTERTLTEVAGSGGRWAPAADRGPPICRHRASAPASNIANTSVHRAHAMAAMRALATAVARHTGTGTVGCVVAGL